MDVPNEDLSLENLDHFLNDQKQILKAHKSILKIQINKCQQPVNSYDTNCSTKPSQSTLPSQTKDNSMVNNKSAGYEFFNSREKEKEKLITILSVPKERYSCSNKKVVTVHSSSKLKRSDIITDAREKEKDRLAEIFASSNYKFPRTSNYQISKNLNTGIEFKENGHIISAKTECFNKCESQPHYLENHKYNYHIQKQDPDERSVTNSQKYNLPNIIITEFGEEEKIDPSLINNDNTMVRIGEFSPYNPNHPHVKTTLGIGEYDARRKLILDQQRQDYNENIHQKVSREAGQIESYNNHKCMDAATQTEWEEEPFFTKDTQQNDRRCSNASFQAEVNYLMPSLSVSPVPKCFEGLSEKEIKEQLYREELYKQIEEKNKLKEEMKKREAEEDAKLEAKIRRDQEKMRRQYEEERLQRLELAIKKKERDYILRQRLAAEQQKAIQENKEKKKELIKEKLASHSNTHTDVLVKNRHAQRRNIPLSQSMPSTYASRALADVHEILKQPLLELQNNETLEYVKHSPPLQDLHTSKVSALHSPLDLHNKQAGASYSPQQEVKEVDLNSQRVVDDMNKKRFSPRNEPPSYLSYDISDKIKKVDRMLKEPLLPEAYHDLPPMSPPLLHASMPAEVPVSYPPVNLPQSPPVPASGKHHRKKYEILEDKVVEPYNMAPSDVFTKHNRSVLTQLGAFRRHLQQERLRMQQRVEDESP